MMVLVSVDDLFLSRLSVWNVIFLSNTSKLQLVEISLLVLIIPDLRRHCISCLSIERILCTSLAVS